MMSGRAIGAAVIAAGAVLGGALAFWLSTSTDSHPGPAPADLSRPPASVAATSDNAVCDPREGAAADFTFSMPGLDGTPVTLADYKGKVLLLDFWATWCPPCKVEIPWFIEFYDKYRAQGFEVAGAVVLDDFKLAPPFAREWKMNYPILDAVDRTDVETAFGPFVALPTSLLIGRDGRICQRHVGLTGRDAFERAIKALL
jgi:thiol-disulfide isomerase/thioredoxin